MLAKNLTLAWRIGPLRALKSSFVTLRSGYSGTNRQGCSLITYKYNLLASCARRM